jgi:glycosyltransferase involved in cell wall biosynthesis
VISVVIPCYNAAATLAETVESALSQATPVEVIIVDDGSTDASREVITGFGDRVTALFGPNRGASAARNSGIGLAKGDWFVFLDSDDLITEGSFARRLACADRTDADIVICDWEDFEDGGPVLGRRAIDPQALAGDLEVAVSRGMWAPPAAVIYRRRVVEAVGGFREDLPVIQDARFMFDAARTGARFSHDDHLGARYRVMTQSLSRRSPAKFWGDVLLNGQQIEALWGPVEGERRQVLIDIYDQASRGLFRAGDARFAEAVEAQRRLGGSTRYTRTATLLSSLVGQGLARRAMSLVSR